MLSRLVQEPDTEVRANETGRASDENDFTVQIKFLLNGHCVSSSRYGYLCDELIFLQLRIE